MTCCRGYILKTTKIRTFTGPGKEIPLDIGFLLVFLNQGWESGSSSILQLQNSSGESRTSFHVERQCRFHWQPVANSCLLHSAARVSHKTQTTELPHVCKKVIIGEGFWKHQRWTPHIYPSPPSLLLGSFTDNSLELSAILESCCQCLCSWRSEHGPSVSVSACQVLRFINWVFIMVLGGGEEKGMNVGSQPTSSQLRVWCCSRYTESLLEKWRFTVACDNRCSLLATNQ